MLDHNAAAGLGPPPSLLASVTRIAFMQASATPLDRDPLSGHLRHRAADVIVVRVELCIFLEKTSGRPSSLSLPCTICSPVHTSPPSSASTTLHHRRLRAIQDAGLLPRELSVSLDDIIVAEVSINPRSPPCASLSPQKWGFAAAPGLLVQRIQSPMNPYPQRSGLIPIGSWR